MPHPPAARCPQRGPPGPMPPWRGPRQNSKLRDLAPRRESNQPLLRPLRSQTKPLRALNRNQTLEWPEDSRRPCAEGCCGAPPQPSSRVRPPSKDRQDPHYCPEHLQRPYGGFHGPCPLSGGPPLQTLRCNLKQLALRSSDAPRQLHCPATQADLRGAGRL